VDTPTADVPIEGETTNRYVVPAGPVQKLNKGEEKEKEEEKKGKKKKADKGEILDM